MSKNRLVIANWKMNPRTLIEAKDLAKSTRTYASKMKNLDVIICPPAVFLESLKSSSKTKIGAQDISKEEQGSFTGQVSAKQVVSVGASYVIIGHSERRAVGETDQDVAGKVLQSVVSGLLPIVCIGEKIHDTDGEYLKELKEQITIALSLIKKTELWKVTIAYEPVWAIGAKEAMSPHDIYETVLYLRKILSDIYGKTVGTSINIIYGGSVDATNARSIIKEGNVGGILVGRQSWNMDTFGPLLKAVDSII